MLVIQRPSRKDTLSALGNASDSRYAVGAEVIAMIVILISLMIL